MKWFKLLLSGLMLLSTSNWAKDVGQDSSLLTFNITPKICIGQQVGDPCSMTVALTWQTESAVDSCLYQNEQKLRCWNNTASVKEQLNVDLKSQSIFQLRAENSQTVLGEQKININYQINKKYRRRLRSDWSIF